jgi:glutamine synthetase
MSETVPLPEPVLPASILERWIGRPPSQFTVEDLVETCRERRVRLVSLMHVAGDGQLKTLDFIPRSPSHLKDVLQGGERADGSSLFPGTGLPSGASDIVLRPRPERAFLDPFSPYPTLAVLCGHLTRKGDPLPQSPDTIVRRAHQRLVREHGVDLHALGEVEYFLGLSLAQGEASGKSERGYHATAPFVFGEELRRRALVLLGEMGIPVKYGHSEVGYIEPDESQPVTWEQHEVEMDLLPLPEAADAVALVHWVLKNLAARHGMRLSFEPIVRVGHAGSGLHFHFSPMLAGRHVGGRDGNGGFSPPAKWLIAGLVRLGGALMAFGNRREGSFIRLSQAKEAPSTVAWGEADRGALIRLPVTVRATDGRLITVPTIEFRLPDGSAHPHFLLAGAAQALAFGATIEDLDDLLARTESRRVRAQPGEASPIPKTFAEVVEELARRRGALEAGEVFPPALLDLVTRTRPA